METVKDFENFLVNLKEGDLPFLNEKKFESLMMTIIDVLNIQKTVGKFKIEEKTKQIGRNFLDTDLVYGYIYGFCDLLIQTTDYNHTKGIFILWANVVRHFTEVSDNVKGFAHYFGLIQTKFLKDKKSEFYKGCEIGNRDAKDWVKGFANVLPSNKKNSGELIMGLLILLETYKFKKK